MAVAIFTFEMVLRNSMGTNDVLSSIIFTEILMHMMLTVQLQNIGSVCLYYDEVHRPNWLVRVNVNGTEHIALGM